MPVLSDLPLKTKYTPGDSVYIIIDYKIIPVTVASWVVTVSNPLNDSDGMQVITYSFEERSEQIQEPFVFASENACLAWMKNDYLNRAIESGSGGEGYFKSGLNAAGDSRSFGNWTDFAGFHLQDANFIITGEKVLCSGTATISGANVTGTGTNFTTDFAPGDLFDLTGGTPEDPYGIDVNVLTIADDTHLTLASAPAGGPYTDQFVLKVAPDTPITLLETSGGENTLVFDYCKLTDANLPDSISDPSDNWADFRANVRSYDASTTIMPDGDPIGYPD